MGKLEPVGKNAKQGSPYVRPCVVVCRTVCGPLLAALAVLLASCDNFGGSIEWATYTIVYNANDGSGRTERFTVNYGTVHAIRENIFGHDASFFRGWESPCKARTFAAGYNSRRLATNAGQVISLYAIWDGRIVAFRPNGGSGDVPWPVIGIEYVTLPDASGLSRYGYVFRGWAGTPYHPPHLEASYGVGSRFVPDGDIGFLYAVWVSEDLVYTVDFDANGGLGEGPSRSVVDRGGYTWLPLWYGPYRDGHAFLGWGRSPHAVDYVAGARFTPTGNVTLFAVWVTTVTVSFEANGGLGIGPGPITREVGSYIRLPYRNGLFKTGHVFVGWRDESGDVFLPGQVFGPTGNVTLSAVWRSAADVDFFIVTFDLNGGPGTVPSRRVAISGIGIILPAGEPGHLFLGWGRTPYTVSYSAGTRFMLASSEDVTLFALWREAGPDPGTGNFTISFENFFDIETEESIGPTIRIIGSSEETTGRIIVADPGQYDSGSIRWFLEGVEITSTTHPGVIYGGMREILTLDYRLHDNQIRTHRVTVVVRKDGVPFSKVIVFTVVP